MTIKASKFTKFKNKINSKLIGNYGSDTGLGTDLIINKYAFIIDNYGDKTASADAVQETCKGIIIDSTDFELQYKQGLTIGKNDVRMLIPVEYVIVNTATYFYEFVLNSKTYVLIYSNAIGQVSNISGVVREIVLSPKV